MAITPKKKLDNPENIPGGGGGNSGWGRGRGGNANGGGLGGDRLSPKSGGKPGTESTSYRNSEQTRPDNRAIVKQNKAAGSYQSRDLDKYEKNKAYRQDLKARNDAAAKEKLNTTGANGFIAGAAAVELAHQLAAGPAKPKGTQPNHKVTDWSNHTQKAK